MSDIQPWMDRVEYLRLENIRIEAENARLRSVMQQTEDAMNLFCLRNGGSCWLPAPGHQIETWSGNLHTALEWDSNQSKAARDATQKCPNCNDANSCGDYEGPTCDVCNGTGHVPNAPR